MTRAHSFGLVWPYVAAAALGYLLGSIAAPALAALGGGGSNTSLSRVGFVLRQDPQAASNAWSALDADLQAVHAALLSPQREVFELVVAVRGLNNGGNSDWSRAEKACQALSWPRCDKASLAKLKELSRP